MSVSIIAKQPAEVLRVPVLIRQPVFAPTAIAAIARGLVTGAAPIGAAVVLAGAALTAVLTGGSDGERYLVTVTAAGGDGSVHQEELEVVVIDGAWVMPDGGVAYLTIDEFVGMFGLEEAVRMTDDGTGRIDRVMLVGALRAAQGIANGNLAARYAVPIATVPELVKTAIADIARARLYPGGAPDGVATAAKDALRVLERIADGKLPLPLDAGETAASAETAAPVLISPGERRYPKGSVIGW